MMQSRREHGSSGELDVFGATSYFAGLLAPDDGCRRSSGADQPSSDADLLPIQAATNKLQRYSSRMEDGSFRDLRHVILPKQLGVAAHDDDDERRRAQQAQLVVATTKPNSGNKTSKLAALLSFMVSPSPRASFRKEEPLPQPPRPPSSRSLRAGEAGDDEPAKKSSSSSRESTQLLQGYGALHDLDLGLATGDRRLQGVKVVRGGGDEETWVVRCSACWDGEHQQEKMVVDAAEAAGDEHRRKDGERTEEGDDGDGGMPGDDCQSDSSSDLFDLDIDYIV